MKRLLAPLLGAAFFLYGCGFYHEKNPGNPATITASAVTWTQVYYQVLQPRCMLCHSVGGAGFNASGYQSVVAMITQVQDRAISRQSMPPDSPLTPYETALLQDWISNNLQNGPGPQ